MARTRRGNGQGTLFRRQEHGSWIASWFDHDGKRRERSTRTTDKRAAERILAKYVADAALRREGVIDPQEDRIASEGRKPLSLHIEDYLAYCRNAELDARHIDQKGSHLQRLVAFARARRLADLAAEVLGRHMRSLRDAGLSARTANFVRQITVAFLSWCVKTGRVQVNRLNAVPRHDESVDRRRVRRPLTDDELARLLEVAEDQGREAWYAAAVWAGLRKSDLLRLQWADVDFENSTITVRGGKAKRTDMLPIHTQLAIVLLKRKADSRASGFDRVFPPK